MRRLLFEVSQFAPFLRGQRGALQIQRALKVAAGNPETDLDDVLADGKIVQGRDLRGANLSRWRARGATFTGLQGAGLSWQVMDADGAVLRDCDLSGARLTMVSLRDADIRGVQLDGAALVLCDLSGSSMGGVSLAGARLNACDLTGAILDDVDLSGADLRGCVLRGAWLTGANLHDAKVGGADLRGCAGLSTDARADLAGRGARVGGGWAYRLWERVLGVGDSSAPATHALVRSAVTWSWAVIASLIPVLFFLRAALNPINPDEPPFWEGSWEEPEEPEDAEPQGPE